jgi:starch-binding outer membrane protein, SusD/RagB family
MTFMKKYIGLAFLSLLFLGCELEQEPQATTPKSAVFGNESGLELYAASFYSILPQGNTKLDAMSDYLAIRTVPDFIRKDAYSPILSSGWNWNDLRNINYFIVNNNDPKVPADVRRHYQGVARFFRAYFYFEKVVRFGDVPWINKPLDVADPALYAGRDSRTLVMDSVLADVNYACANLRSANDPTRSLITKWVAYALKSRVSLFEGTFRKYSSTQHHLPTKCF